MAGLLGSALAGSATQGATLPENKAEALYHLYDGGGVTAQGPALLVRKSLADKVSLRQRVHALLRRGPCTREQIAAEWPEEKLETLRRTVNREIEKGRLVRFPGPGGVEQIGLAARAS